MDSDILSFGDLKFYRLGSGNWVPVYDPELRRNLHDWCGIEPGDFEISTPEEDEDEDDGI